MTEWQTLISSLPVRRQPTSDEIRDAKNRETKRNRLQALVKERNDTFSQEVSKLNDGICKLAKQYKGITYAELVKEMKLSEAKVRGLCKQLLDENRLKMKIGAAGRKYFYGV